MRAVRGLRLAVQVHVRLGKRRAPAGSARPPAVHFLSFGDISASLSSSLGEHRGLQQWASYNCGYLCVLSVLDLNGAEAGIRIFGVSRA